MSTHTNPLAAMSCLQLYCNTFGPGPESLCTNWNTQAKAPEVCNISVFVTSAVSSPEQLCYSSTRSGIFHGILVSTWASLEIPRIPLTKEYTLKPYNLSIFNLGIFLN